MVFSSVGLSVCKGVRAVTDLSDRTKEIYKREIKRFRDNFQLFAEQMPEEASDAQIEAYMLEYCPGRIQTLPSWSIHLAAVKYWYHQVHGRKFPLAIPHPDLKRGAPQVLADDELGRIFEALRYHVCGLMIRLIFGTGIRLREVIGLRVGDTHCKRKLLEIRERGENYFVSFPEHLQVDMMHAVYGKAPDDYVFSVRRDRFGKPTPMSGRTLQLVLNRAVRELGLVDVTVQTLRDNFAIRFLQAGGDSKELQAVMGFRNVQSVSHYIRHLAVQSEEGG